MSLVFCVLCTFPHKCALFCVVCVCAYHVVYIHILYIQTNKNANANNTSVHIALGAWRLAFYIYMEIHVGNLGL